MSTIYRLKSDIPVHNHPTTTNTGTFIKSVSSSTVSGIITSISWSSVTVYLVGGCNRVCTGCFTGATSPAYINNISTPTSTFITSVSTTSGTFLTSAGINYVNTTIKILEPTPLHTHNLSQGSGSIITGVSVNSTASFVSSISSNFFSANIALISVSSGTCESTCTGCMVPSSTINSQIMSSFSTTTTTGVTSINSGSSSALTSWSLANNITTIYSLEPPTYHYHQLSGIFDDYANSVSTTNGVGYTTLTSYSTLNSNYLATPSGSRTYCDQSYTNDNCYISSSNTTSTNTFITSSPSLINGNNIITGISYSTNSVLTSLSMGKIVPY